jgi:tetratricopeptide (TPR) repeat protein
MKIEPIGKYKVKLLESYTRLDVTVPINYIFDGASIPRPFWIFFHPFMYLQSSVFHDYLYSIAIANYKKGEFAKAKEYFKKADKIFLKALQEDDRKVARLFYNAVRLYRYFKFPKAR